MYAFLLPLHNIVRWLVVAAALFAVIRAFAGWLGKKNWTALDDKAGVWFASIMDVQLLLGLILYFISPLLQTAFQNFGGAMGNTVMRFFAVEHIFLMIVAVVLAHVGRALSKKAVEPAKKHRMAAIFFGLAILAILFAIPWPFSGVPRPWIRLF